MSSTPVPGTPWCIVWTGDNKSFFFNPTTKKSVWERPPELVGRADVKEMLKSAAAAEKVKRKTAQGGSKSDESGSDSDEVLFMTRLLWMFFRFRRPMAVQIFEFSPSDLTGLSKNNPDYPAIW